jgi:hypothetical protein
VQRADHLIAFDATKYGKIGFSMRTIALEREFAKLDLLTR